MSKKGFLGQVQIVVEHFQTVWLAEIRSFLHGLWRNKNMDNLNSFQFAQRRVKNSHAFLGCGFGSRSPFGTNTWMSFALGKSFLNWLCRGSNWYGSEGLQIPENLESNKKTCVACAGGSRFGFSEHQLSTSSANQIRDRKCNCRMTWSRCLTPAFVP